MAPTEKRVLKHQATHYALLGDILYKHSFNGVLLRCLQLYDQQIIMFECHDSIQNGCFSSIDIAKCILWMDYYQPTMKCNCNEYVNKYIKCQQHACLQHVLSQPLQYIQAMWPFAKWGFDLINQFIPSSSNDNKFIIIAIEYLTKWVEAILLVSMIGLKIISFLKTHIIC